MFILQCLLKGNYQMNKQELSPISKEIWPWMGQEESGTDKGKSPSLQLSFFMLVIALCISGVFYFFNRFWPSIIILTISIILFCCAVFFPSIYQIIHRIFQVFGRWVGRVLTWVLLVPFFYIFFPIGRLIQKISGNDPLHRRCPSSKRSYWIVRESGSDHEGYRRQF